MTHPNASTALARVVIDELAARGVDLIVISPGSRSGALAIAAAQHPDLETRVIIDERSAAFHALGAAQAASRPVAVVATSGSAPANFFPAIVEADASCLPLVVISADRPAELQGVGANQTIGQVGMFGDKVRLHAGIEAPDSATDRNADWRSCVARLLAAARGSPPGPVHLNVRFREPTVPVTDDGRTVGEPYRFDTPRTEVPASSPVEGNAEIPEIPEGRGLIVAGDGEYDRSSLASRAADLGWPVLATALSGMRGGEVVGAYHHILSDGVPAELRPDVVIAVGAIGPSPRLEELVASAGERIRVDRWGRTIDPGRNATQLIRGDFAAVLARAPASGDEGWSGLWARADREARERIAAVLGATDGPSGAGVASALNDLDWDTLVVASSLPIREVDAHLSRRGAVFSNRGASGIDGFVSTALGVASRRPRALALAGDLSILHDSNGFLCEGPIDLTLVVIDNQGGGLFDSLPQATHAPEFERLFVTRPRRDLEALARFHRLHFGQADDEASLRDLVGEALDRPGVDLIRVPIERNRDLAVRAQLGS